MIPAPVALGEHKFGQTFAIRVMLALVFLVPAAVMVAVALTITPPDKTLLGIAVTLVIATVAVWVILSQTELTIDDAGVRRKSAFGSQELAWSEIVETRYLVSPINLGLHFGLIGMLVAATSKTKPANLTLRLCGADGKSIKITSNFRNAKEAIGIILGRILPPLVAAARAAIQRGEVVQFGSVALSSTELSWKRKAIPVSEVVRAEIVGRNLRVKRSGKWLDFIAVRSDKVPNVLVFLEVLESLAPALHLAGVDPLARVRL